MWPSGPSGNLIWPACGFALPIATSRCPYRGPDFARACFLCGSGMQPCDKYMFECGRGVTFAMPARAAVLGHAQPHAATHPRLPACSPPPPNRPTARHRAVERSENGGGVTMHPEMQGHTHKTQKVTPNTPVTPPKHQISHTRRPQTPERSHEWPPDATNVTRTVSKHQKKSQRRAPNTKQVTQRQPQTPKKAHQPHTCDYQTGPFWSPTTTPGICLEHGRTPV